MNALLQERSVTGAAQRLGISQPAMSAQLAKLRYRIDDPVLVAGKNGMIPTARSAAIAEPLREHLVGLADLAFTTSPFDPKTAERTFRIGATDYAHAVLLAPLLERIADHAPGVRIAALPFDTVQADGQLDRGELDMIITSERLIPQSIPALKLFEDRFIVVMRSEHPMAPETLTLESFCQQRHFLVSPSGGSFEGAIDIKLKELGHERRVVGSLPSFLLVQSVLSESDAIMAVPEKLASRLGKQMITKPLPIEVDPFAIYCGWHTRDTLDPGHKWLRSNIHT
ncbi:LysR family transcriptional regulator [Parasphingorhabdus litoris]|nr:LysR family transcriptional regulator [Parasphingorhabdus litoris]